MRGPIVERLVLHVGMHKTGTSSIQQSLEGTDADGFRYADLGQPNHCGAMIAAFGSEALVARKAAKRGHPPELVRRRHERALERLRETFARPARTVLISAEDLCTFDAPGLARLRDFAAPYVGRTEVVGFVRPPRSGIESALQERVKSGYAKDVPPSPPYRKAFERAHAVFGAPAVTVLPFRTADFVQGSLLRTFLAAIGEGDAAVAEVRANEGIGADAVRLVYRMNRLIEDSAHGKENYAAQRWVVGLLAERLPRQRLALSDAALCSGAIAADIRWLRETTGLDFTADLGRMTGDADAARAAFAREMAAIDPATVPAVTALAAEVTGAKATDLDAALRALWQHGRTQRAERTRRRHRAPR